MPIENLDIIAPGNVGGLHQLIQVSLGEEDRVNWSPDERAFTINTPLGLTLYRVAALSEPITIQTGSPPCFSPDGLTLATAHPGGPLRLWDLLSGEELLTLSGLADDIVHMVFSPDSRLLAAIAQDNTGIVWNIDSGEVLTTLSIPDWVMPVFTTYDVLFSPDQSHLALFRDGELILWDLVDGGEPGALHWEPPPAGPYHGPVGFSPDWRHVVWGTRGSLLIMDVATGEHLHTYDVQVGAPYEFTPDWGMLLVVGYNDDTISVWDPLTAQPIHMLVHEDTVFKFWVSPDERYLASLTFQDYATLWDLTNGEKLAELSAPGQAVNDLVFSPDSRFLAIRQYDGTLTVWDVSNPLYTLSDAVEAMQFSPDGSVLATASSSTGMTLWNTMDAQELLTFDLSGTTTDAFITFRLKGRLLEIKTYQSLELWGTP